MPSHSGIVQGVLDVVAHRHGVGGNEDQLDVSCLTEQECKRARRATEAKIADQRDLEIVESSQLVVDGVEVQQCLRWMLAGAVPTIDDRDRRGFRCSRGSALLVVPDHDAVRVP